MAQAIVFGRVTTGLELKTSLKNNPYVMFSLAEHFGFGRPHAPNSFRCGRGGIWHINW